MCADDPDPMKVLTVRQLARSEMAMAAAVMRRSFNHRLPHLAGLHTPEEDEYFFREIVYPSCEVWGAFMRNALVGVIAFHPGEIEQLCIDPSAQRRGIGTALLARAKDVARKAGTALELSTFQCNGGARSFYESHGFTPVGFSDGANNEERAPDIRYRWTATPIAS
jgi:ribosomal protein S18 acetylase RimI-like enzyme